VYETFTDECIHDRDPRRLRWRAAAATVHATNVQQTLRAKARAIETEQRGRKTRGERKRETESLRGESRREKKRVFRASVESSARLVCVPCSECTEQALLVRGHLSYDRSAPTLPARLPLCLLPASYLPTYLPTYQPTYLPIYLSTSLARLTALFFFTLLLSQRPSCLWPNRLASRA